ncbi:hypothetical protein [Chromatium okenii]|uniref:hypothetical protein n=1 Tax=Chromatium okenii TaxID=61644 RepID=UPI0018D56193|nr:hypothetical protein [Chromatium okenii]
MLWNTALKPVLNGEKVAAIYADLTASTNEVTSDLTGAKTLAENAGVAFQGVLQVGEFDIAGDLARKWLLSPNPHGKPNSDVLRPGWNGLDVVRRNRDIWMIDFGCGMPEKQRHCMKCHSVIF